MNKYEANKRLMECIPHLNQFNGKEIRTILDDLRSFNMNGFRCFVVHTDYKNIRGLISFNIEEFGLTDMIDMKQVFSTQMLFKYTSSSQEQRYDSTPNKSYEFKRKSTYTPKKKQTTTKKKKEESVEIQGSLF
jgi:hypothetical protein